ncbi:FkbM family methyltransferase [Denitromonas halophila]|nr:FkbM family methyltransferase [Denitromonas halophila]
MKTQLKQALKGAIRYSLATGGRTQVGRYVFKQILDTSMEEVRELVHEGVQLRFATPNALCDWRAQTFSTKEPETLAWIDAIPEGAVVWDVGANIGLYAVYAAARRKCRVWAFEPSVFNLELLARNVHLNGLVSQVCIVPFALSNAVGSNTLRMTTTEWGGALSTFGEAYGWDGEAIKRVFEFQTMGLPMDAARDLLGIPQPDFVKMDVDGIEHLILSGGASVLKAVKEVLIEVNDDFKEQAEGCERLLKAAGLTMKHKLHSEMIDNSTTGFQNTYNQIWVREPS